MSIILPIDDVVLVTPPLAELTTLVVREPAGATRLGVLAVAGAHVGAVSAHLEPLTQEALVISRLQSYFSFRNLPQWSSRRKDVEHLLTRPIHDWSPRDDRESRRGRLEAQIVSAVRSHLAEQLGFLYLVAPVYQSQVNADTVGIAGDIRRCECGGLDNLSID